MLSIVRKHSGTATRVESRRILSGGKFNTTYRIRTRDPDGDLVLRFAPTRQDLLYRHERALLRAEIGVYPLLASRGVPVPKVIGFDDSHAIVDRDYLFTEFIESVPLQGLELTPADRREILRALGGHCRAIHSISSQGFGWFGMQAEHGLSATWLGFLAELAAEIAERSERYAVTPEKYILKLQGLLAGNPGLFTDPQAPALLHNDLYEGNILMREKAGAWEMAAILDADRALFGDPDFEFGALSLLGDGFMEGYGRPLDMSPEAAYRRRVYNLIKDMIDADACKVQLGAERSYGILARSIATLSDSL